ncbi:NAD(P)H-dependent oxidoreductase [Vibrio coralliirubri]|uniref:NAD(P)H-dependent oxidoreductase n=1 Tax=Vibrio coralliirubri TaxID=1516159 RepID=UPI000B3618C8|nr:NAD(P)H-dependent oxidoreductase [Vibrio coralliirubri]
MSKTLVISGHPNLAESYTNTLIIDTLETQMADVSIRRLDTLYPDYKIDVEAEQAALIEADVIVLQFPFYWYSAPALLKKWLDDVMTFNFAYGPEGNKLKGKDLFLSFTIGGPKESYDPLSYNHFTIEQLMFPLQQTAYLAGMNYRPPVYTHGMVYIPNVYNKLEDVQARAKQHASRLMDEVRKVTHSDEELVRKFVTNWFEQLDTLPTQESMFTQSLSSNVVFNMPEGQFVGHAGFKDWYAIARSTFKPNCSHGIEQLEIKPIGSQYQVSLHVRLKADTFPDSSMKGESIELVVNETWLVSVDDTNNVKIHEYEVVALS